MHIRFTKNTYKIVDDLNHGAGSVVGPERARVNALDPRREGAAVATAGEHPGHAVGIAASIGGERELDILGEVRRVVDGVLQGQILQVLGGQLVVRARVAPVPVLEDDGGRAELLRQGTGESPVRQVSGISCRCNLARGEEDDGRPGPLPVLGAPPEGLAEGTLGGIRVVEDLLEGAIPEGGRGVGVAPLDEAGGELGIGNVQRRRDQVHKVDGLNG